MFKFYDVIKCLSIKKKYILLNNLGSKRSQLTKFGQFIYYKRKKISKNSTKTAIWKLVPGPFVLAKN